MNKIERVRGKTRIGHTQFQSDDTLRNFPGTDVTLKMFDMWNSIQAVIIRVDANYGHIIFLGKEAGLVTAFDSNIEQPRFFVDEPAPSEIYSLPLHDAHPLRAY